MPILALLFALLFALTGCAPNPEPADSTDVEQRLAALELQLAALQAEQQDAVDAIAELSANTGERDLAQDLRLGDADARLDALESSCVSADWLAEQDYASEDFVRDQAFVTMSWVLSKDYLVDQDLDGLARESWVSSQGYAAHGDLVSLNARVGDLETEWTVVDQLLSYVQVDVAEDAVRVVGANLYVESGAGSTDAQVNGLGNLIIGYGEAGNQDTSGSHNLVLGTSSGYGSYGGIVAGSSSAVAAPYAVALGYGNTASGDYATVTGGREGEASGSYASVSGGWYSEASGSSASVTGGYETLASDSCEVAW